MRTYQTQDATTTDGCYNLRNTDSSIEQAQISTHVTIALQGIGNEQEALKMANLFISEVRRPIHMPNGCEARISMSVGIAIYPQHGVTGELLSERADQAMYQVKKRSKSAALVYF